MVEKIQHLACAKFCACCCNASFAATCGASPAKLCCLVVNALAASCLALKPSAVSPGCCDIPAIPVVTIGTPVCAVICFARSLPKSSTNCAGNVLCSCYSHYNTSSNLCDV